MKTEKGQTQGAQSLSLTLIISADSPNRTTLAHHIEKGNTAWVTGDGRGV